MSVVPAASDLPPPSRTLTFGLLLVILGVAFESMAVATVLPRVADDLRGLHLYGWASSAFLLSSLFGTVLAGILTDRRGSAVSAGACLVMFSLGLVIAGFAPSMLVFVLGRFVQGFGAGGLSALPFAVISQRYPEAVRAKMLAGVAATWLLPALVGPVIASLIADTFSWRVVFWGMVPVMVLVAPLCVLPLRGAWRPAGKGGPGRAALWSALLLAVSAGTLVEGMRQTGLPGVLLAALGAAGVLFAARLVFPRGLARLRPGLPAALMVRGLTAFAVLGASTLLPLALRELHGLSLTQAGWILSVGGVTWSVGSFAQSRIEAWFGVESRVLRVRLGMFGVTLGLLVTSLAVLGHLPLAVVYAGWCLTGFSMGIGYNTNSLFALSSVRGPGSGRLSGQLASIEVLMTGLGAGFAGALMARVTPLSVAFGAAFTAMLVASLLTWLAAARLTSPQGDVERARAAQDG